VKLSIIIPALNEASNIANAVRRAIELGPHEILVVDGGSTDGTLDLVADLDCRVIDSPRGRSFQQNLGARESTGDTLLFLHADCWLPSSATLQMEQTLRSSRVPGGVFCQRIEARGPTFRFMEAGNALRVCCTRLGFGDQGIFLRREVFESLGGFPQTRLIEDVLLMRKLRDSGRLALLPGPLHVDARRWEKHGPVRQTLRNWLLLTAEQLGASPDQLARFYLPHWQKFSR
jgi:rSAM/selenodomain-associated transferase 2